MDPPAPTPTPTPVQNFIQGVTNAVLWFNLLAIVVDIIPFWVVCYVPREVVNRYLSVRALFLGAAANFVLVCHILFVLHPDAHMDALFVAFAGLFIGTACAFIAMLQRPDDRSTSHLMAILIFLLGFGSFFILYGIAQNFRADEGFDIIIGGYAVTLTVLLNILPQVTALFGLDLEPDLAVDRYGLLMTFLATIDSWFFVAYAQLLGKFGSLLSVISLANASCNLVQFVIFLARMHG